MIAGFSTPDTRVRRNWQARPRWWSIEVIVPEGTPLYREAKARACSFGPLRLPDFRLPIEQWLEDNCHKPYRLKYAYVEFQNHSDAMLFFLALK